MTCTLLRSATACCVVLLASCATAPTSRYSGMDSEQSLTVVAKERHRLIEQFVDADAIGRSRRFAVPRVEVGANARGSGVSETQAALVANNAGRALCSTLGKYIELDDTPDSDAPTARLVITAIVPTGRAAAGASSVMGIFIPVPFRLPAGLGALAGEAEVRDGAGSQLAAMHWVRGANSVTNSAKVSTIGDAWQLARQFGNHFARVLLDANPKVAGVQHARAKASVQAANRRICAARFGTVNLAGRGASLVLPLSPESIDAGAPLPGKEEATRP